MNLTSWLLKSGVSNSLQAFSTGFWKWCDLQQSRGTRSSQENSSFAKFHVGHCFRWTLFMVIANADNRFWAIFVNNLELCGSQVLVLVPHPDIHQPAASTSCSVMTPFIWCLLLRYLVVIIYTKCQPYPNIRRRSKSKIKSIYCSLFFFESFRSPAIDAWPFSHGSETCIRIVTLAYYILLQSLFGHKNKRPRCSFTGAFEEDLFDRCGCKSKVSELHGR